VSLEKTLIACLHDIKTKAAFLEGRLFFSQSELLENFSNCSDWLDKSRPSKKPLLFLPCKQAINGANQFTHPTLGPSSLPIVVA